MKEYQWSYKGFTIIKVSNCKYVAIQEDWTNTPITERVEITRWTLYDIKKAINEKVK